MRLLKAMVKSILKVGLETVSFLFAPLFSLVARTGFGMDVCWKYGFLPLPAHYYSPVPDRNRLARFDWDKRANLYGIVFHEASQIDLLNRLSRYREECRWPDSKQEGKYYTLNGQFGYSSACLLHTMLRTFRPARVIEVGAGFSTHIICDALQRNAEEGNKGTLISIEPYPSHILRSAQAKYGIDVLEKPVEDIPFSIFEQLQSGDMLFIDSSHVVRIGGDINALYLEILPRLAPGVIIHVHDIYLPYEYPKSNYFGSQAKYIWTEQYLLQAFLCFNSSFRTLLAAYWLQKTHPSEFLSAFSDYDSQRHRPSSSFYFQRIQ